MPSRILAGCEHAGCPNRSDCPDHMRPRVYVVCGPPGSGKTTYVKTNMSPGDLFFDFDLIMAAITGLPLYQDVPGAIGFVMNMRDGFMDTAIYSKSKVRAVWIISSTPLESERAYLEKDLNAEMIVLDVPESVCVERTSSRGPEWKEIVRKWFVKKRLQPAEATDI